MLSARRNRQPQKILTELDFPQYENERLSRRPRARAPYKKTNVLIVPV